MKKLSKKYKDLDLRWSKKSEQVENRLRLSIKMDDYITFFEDKLEGKVPCTKFSKNMKRFTLK